MNNKMFRLLAGIILVVVMFVAYLVLANNDDNKHPNQQSPDGVVLK